MPSPSGTSFASVDFRTIRGDAREVVAVEIEQVEDIEDETVMTAHR
jgi:hypothetical protein